MTTATVKRGTVTDTLVSRFGEIFGPDGFLTRYNVEREEDIELLGLSVISGIDPLFIGAPGTGKTWMIELLLMLIDGVGPDDLYSTLVFKETPAQDLLGPMNPGAMKNGDIERMVEGFLPTAVMAYLDEIWKSSPTLVNALLDIQANRKLKVGKRTLDCSQLLCIVGSSNELPDREDMQAARDRWGLTKFVQPVRTPEGRKRVMQIQDEFQAGNRTLDLKDAPMISLEDLGNVRTEVRGIIIPDTVREAMAEAQEKWAQKGFEPSQRRIGQMIVGMKAKAWARGDGNVSTDDMLMASHMAWNHPDHAKDAREVVMEFANVFARKALRMKEALEPILSEVSEIRKKLNEGSSVDDVDEDGFKLMRNLRTMVRDAKEQIDKGDSTGHDTRDLTGVLGEINRAHDWLKSTLSGADDS